MYLRQGLPPVGALEAQIAYAKSRKRAEDLVAEFENRPLVIPSEFRTDRSRCRSGGQPPPAEQPERMGALHCSDQRMRYD